jgi:hypothetical protein
LRRGFLGSALSSTIRPFFLGSDRVGVRHEHSPNYIHVSRSTVPLSARWKRGAFMTGSDALQRKGHPQVAFINTPP